jgi:hypothetical protein
MSSLPASPLDAVSGSEVLQHPNIADTSSGADLRAAKEEDERRALSARQAALARAAAADSEAALAQQERDAAEARVRAAQDRAARERAAAAPPQPEEDTCSTGTHADDDIPPATLHAALLHHEAATLLNLHAQAVAVTNIRALVPLLLDTNSNFYARWSESFLLTLTKFSLECHVLSDSVFPESPDWIRMNAVVRTWLLGTLFDALADIISQRSASARTLWLSIESQFLGNRTTRALYADQEFRSFSQGDLPVAEYCRRYKKLAEDLRDLGEPVSDRTLVLNIVRGLNERFQALGLHLRRTNPLPSFLQVRDDLALEELTMAKAAPAAALAALSNTGSSTGSQSSQPRPPSPNHQQQTGGRGSGGGSFQHRGKRGKRGGRSSGGNRGGSSHTSTPPGGHNYYNPWTGSIYMWPGSRPPTHRPPTSVPATPPQLPQAFLAGPPGQWAGSCPPPPLQAYGLAPNYTGAAAPGAAAPPPGWDLQQLATNFQTTTLQHPQQQEWFFDTGASSHMNSDAGILSHLSSSNHLPSNIVVGNGNLLPVTSTGTTQLPYNFCLNIVLLSPSLIKDLISVRQFTTDNNYSVEFDPLGCSVKDLPTRRVILRCDSSGPLYPLKSTTSSLHATTSSLWHQRLGHPGSTVLTQLAQSSAIPCTPNKNTPLCHACQLGRHVRLPFHSSSSHATRNFQLIHCDLWTSPITSVSGHKYYLAILDDYSHYLWTFPLRLKSDTFSTLTNFFAYVRTQFGVTVQGVQCDNGREFDNLNARDFFSTHGVLLRMSCPYTSPQNGKAERIIRSINNVVRTLLFQASIPPTF